MTPDYRLVMLALLFGCLLAVILHLSGCSNLDGLRHLPELSRMLRSGQ